MLWPAPFRGDKKVSARVVIPGSKSVTNRALILAAQATSPSLLKRPLISRDTELMVAGLRAMGVGIKDVQVDGDLAWEITPATSWTCKGRCWKCRNCNALLAASFCAGTR